MSLLLKHYNTCKNMNVSTTTFSVACDVSLYKKNSLSLRSRPSLSLFGNIRVIYNSLQKLIK